LNIETVLAAADVVVLTSDNEGTPLSLIQAGMAGLPVVSTNVGSVSEIIIANETGILTPLESIQIADSLELCINSHDLRKQLGNAAKDFTFANFGTARLVSDHKDLYAKLFSSQANF
jgi:glycosyltransferase involved in cell wall biosynthesis